MNATVCMPWRPQPSRMAAYRRVRAFWSTAGFRVLPMDSGPGPFNRARARNHAVRYADADIVVLADADTLPDLLMVRDAIRTVDDEAVWPFDRFRLIDKQWTLYEGDLSRAPAVDGEDWQYGQVTGGCIVVRSESYWRAGGFDERFVGWGGEDTAFRCAANTLIGGRRIPGLLIGFNHSGQRRLDSNFSLRAKYKEADLHPLAMLRLTTDPARFAPSEGL